MSNRAKPFRHAFTLLEVVLAVALTAIIGTLIATAIDFHLRQLTVQRTRIEEAQVARAVLRRIADDLRAATLYRPAETASPDEMSADTSSTADDSSREVLMHLELLN